MSAVSRYEQYWVMLKANRGKVLELQVPTEFQERIVKALRKRKTREHNTTYNYYPEFVFVRNPKLPDGRVLNGILWVTLPLDMIDLI
jgi:hypothetical protein